MVVKRGDLDSAVRQLLHYRVDLFVQQHQVAHHHRFAAHFLEGKIRPQRKRRPDLDAVEGHLQVATSKADAVYAAGHLCP